jgi:phenylacetate-CoA ligase
MSLRVLEERYFVEVLDVVSGSAVEEGEMGELTLTPLGRSAWPLLRYRTGDLVRARRDESGNLQLIGGILGRTDDMVIVRGVNLYPGAVEQVVRSIPEIGEYRVSVKRAKAMAEVLVEIESTRNASLASELERAFEKAFALRIPVCVVPQGSLPQFEFKARRWRVEPPEC